MEPVFQNRVPSQPGATTHIVMSHIISYEYLWGGCGSTILNCTDKEAIKFAKGEVERNNKVSSYRVMRFGDQKTIATFRMITEYTEDLD